MENQSELDLLLIGVEESGQSAVEKIANGLRLLSLNTAADVGDFLDSTNLAPGSVVIVSNFCAGMTHLEIAQALSSSYEKIHIIFLTSDRSLFDLASLTKNGFTEIFLLPMDSARFQEQIQNFRQQKGGGAFRKYKAVKLVDLGANVELPFDVSTFLTLNRKYVKLTVDGKLSAKKFQTLKDKNVKSVYIQASEVSAFYEFAAEQMLKLGETTEDGISETERAEKFQSNVRGLFRSFLDVAKDGSGLEQGRDLLEQSKKVVESYVVKKTGMDLHKTFDAIMGASNDCYSHAQAVSTIATLLSMATGIGQPEELAIAGLFHDIGLLGTREDISIFDLPDLKDEERNAFLAHPKSSLNILREKRVTLVPIIAEILEKHHERVDGKGFPLGLPGHKIPMEAQLLSYADAFEYLSRPKAGAATLTPREIHQKIASSVGLSVEILMRIEVFICASSSSESNDESLQTNHSSIVKSS